MIVRLRSTAKAIGFDIFHVPDSPVSRAMCFVEPQIGSEYLLGHESNEASSGTVKAGKTGMVARR
jgi:hypothetical protein